MIPHLLLSLPSTTAAANWYVSRGVPAPRGPLNARLIVGRDNWPKAQGTRIGCEAAGRTKRHGSLAAQRGGLNLVQPDGFRARGGGWGAAGWRRGGCAGGGSGGGIRHTE